jgi:uncharacterized protein YaeQ
MALSSRPFVFEIALSDVDRGVYDALTLRPAQHPSESDAWLVTRVLAFALCAEEGMAFSHGLDEPDEPALWSHDLTGRLMTSVELGTPDAARLHKASKASARVVVVCHKAPDAWLSGLRPADVHAPERVELVLIDPAFVDALAATVGRRNAWAVTLTDGTLYVDTGAETRATSPVRFPLPDLRRHLGLDR